MKIIIIACAGKMLRSLERVWDKLKQKRTQDIILFFVTNILLNFIDIISDGMTAVALSKHFFYFLKLFCLFYKINFNVNPYFSGEW